MKHYQRFCNILLSVLIFTGMDSTAQSGVSCPPNIDFEFGDFEYWQCFTGSTFASGNTNSVNVSVSTPTPGRHTLLSTADLGVMDTYGNFPVKCPNGSGYSVKLGNSIAGSEAERVAYAFTIPNNQTEYSIVYQYAVVFEDPQHEEFQQPRFTAKVYDVFNNQYVSCATFDYVATSNLPGFRRSPVDPGVWYKDWTPVTIDLSGYAGRTIVVEFTTADCTLGGHFGYAYVDVNIGCSSPVSGAFYCPGSDSIVLTAPFGFQNYYWYPGDFSQLLGTSSTLTLTPPPAINTTFALDIIPYDGFGCRDTVYTSIQIGASPVAEAGADKNICRNQETTLGPPPLPGQQYNWEPATGLNDSLAANPLASPTTTTEYVLTTTNMQGCSARDTISVIVEQLPVATFNVNAVSQCLQSNNFLFNHDNSAGSILQWHFGDGNSTAIANPAHVYDFADTYEVKLIATSTTGCADSSNKIVMVHPTPEGSLGAEQSHICEGSHSVITATGGSSYNWFKDGIAISLNQGNAYQAVSAGAYTAEIISEHGCRNFAANTVALSMVKKPIVDFVYDLYCVDVPVRFKNKSVVTESGNVDYRWDFAGLGNSSSSDETFSFGTAGNTKVRLTVTPRMCPSLATTLEKIISIEMPSPGLTYYPQNAVINRALQLNARTFGADYLWTPSSELNNFVSASPVFLGSREQLYFIRIIAPSGCTTIDTQLVRIFKERNIHVPKAFTPNGDGRNDRMFPFLAGIKELKYFRIINRWGVIVFQSKTDTPGWDGTFKGAPQPMDGYTWEAEAIDANGEFFKARGTFTLVR